uniref:Src like adaptor 1a n=1 Tax=Salmo trutta TaxID=8032 RepID=A0A674EEI1_SALTR
MGNVMWGRGAGDKTNSNYHDSALKEGEDDTLVVLHDYPSPDISEPIFRMGEKLRVLSQEGNWWRVRSVQSGSENYIPNNHTAKVYHGWLFEGVVRQKAEELLSLPENRVGSFMIRESTQQRVCVYVCACACKSISDLLDSADGLCCVLTGPCLSRTISPIDITSQPPPVAMRHNNFDWKKIDRKDLISAGAAQGQENRNAIVSYGVRNSMASYLSLVRDHDPGQQKKNRKKKSKSVCVIPDHSLSHMDLDEDYDM